MDPDYLETYETTDGFGFVDIDNCPNLEDCPHTDAVHWDAWRGEFVCDLCELSGGKSKERAHPPDAVQSIPPGTSSSSRSAGE